MKIEKCQDMLLSDITNLYLIPNQAKAKFFFSGYPLVYKKEPVYPLTQVLVTYITNSKGICISNKCTIVGSLLDPKICLSIYP